jgi:hypothetical protein
VEERFGATKVVDSSEADPIAAVRAATGGRGADTVIEAVGVLATFELCQELIDEQLLRELQNQSAGRPRSSRIWWSGLADWRPNRSRSA